MRSESNAYFDGIPAQTYWVALGGDPNAYAKTAIDARLILLGGGYYDPGVLAVFKFGGKERLQTIIKFHEFAHAYTKQTDGQLARTLQKAGAHIRDEDITNNPSDAIANWQNQGCPYTLPKRDSNR